ASPAASPAATVSPRCGRGVEGGGDAGDAGAGQIGFIAPFPAAAAGKRFKLQIIEQPCRYADMADLAGKAGPAARQVAIDAYATSNAGADDQAEYGRRTFARAAIGFRQGKALAIVLDGQKGSDAPEEI